MVTIYAYAGGFTRDENGSPIMMPVECSKERYEEEDRINWQTAYKMDVPENELENVKKILEENRIKLGL